VPNTDIYISLSFISTGLLRGCSEANKVTCVHS
jgi:hypothetical protein